MLSLIPLRVWLLGALVSVLLGFMGWMQWRLHSMRTELAEAQVQLAEAGRTLDQCRTSVSLQNMAVKQWRDAAELRARSAESALRRATVERRKAESRAQALYSVVPTGEECEDLRVVVDTARTGGLQHGSKAGAGGSAGSRAVQGEPAEPAHALHPTRRQPG